jgi:DNA-binding response OmpR family regulator
MSEGVVEDLAREMVQLRRVPSSVIEQDRGPTVDLVVLWIPPNCSEARLAEIVRWRARASSPTALLGCCPGGHTEDSERALAAGFDDFVAGRLSVRELAGRTRALTRRLALATTLPEHRLHYGKVTVDRAQHQLWIGGTRVSVTPTELSVMVALVAARGRALTRAEILDKAWGDENFAAGERAVDNVILRLRRKIDDPDLIVTVRGVGFRLAEH